MGGGGERGAHDKRRGCELLGGPGECPPGDFKVLACGVSKIAFPAF